MRKFTYGMLVLLASITSAKAADPWLGNLIVQNIHRGTTTRTPFTGQTVADNIADYNNFTLQFEFYKAGVTDANVEIWKSIDARVELVRDSSKTVIARGVAHFVERAGNNARYEVRFYDVAPSTVTTIDPEMANRKTMKTHLNVLMDGVERVSVPVEWSYQP